MAKNKNKKDSAVEQVKVKQYPFPLPQVLSRDEFAEKTDDELAALLDSLHTSKDQVLAHDRTLPVMPWEVEICYAHRELGARIGRRQAHEKYLATGKAA